MVTSKRLNDGKPTGTEACRCLVFLLSVSLSLLAPCGARADEAAYPFRDPDLPAAQRIDDLLARMTIDEKIAALGGSADVPRLEVRGTRHIEGYHGVAQGGPSNWGRRNPTPTTQFPQAYGLGATWDPVAGPRGRRRRGL